ncbi:glycosyltransferase [Massilia sp. PAMC28688]|uniref:MraY family glycosyltransferase n=1 Tax=Massilia sp. PAMC28688 TaxID=2861283 RepID=UPI001C62C43A|nr:glycosyltransferase [Massilia sp. PAMC28688]QYF91991.1 glycosyltransferase [Massilia sp. PAMC28688]
MLSIIVSFFVALIVTLYIVRFSHKNRKMLDFDMEGVQKIHAFPVARVGGLGIFLAALAGTCVLYLRAPESGLWAVTLLLSALPAFGCGIVEDYTKNVSPRRRLFFTMISATAAFFLLDAAVVRFDIPMVDAGLAVVWISLPLTIFAIAGVANAVNIIDGFNGLAGAVTMFMFASLAYVAFQVDDMFVMSTALLMVGAIAGFFLWNYPHGLIFMGDGGAYFIGFMLAELAVLLVARNPAVSAWYAILLLIYPVVETVFSIYRRKYIRGVSPGLPDGVHLHMLIFKRVVRYTIGVRDARAVTRRNSLTSPYLWLLSLMAVVPATLCWSNTLALGAFCSMFVMTYVWLYAQIVRFNVPTWLILNTWLGSRAGQGHPSPAGLIEGKGESSL